MNIAFAGAGVSSVLADWYLSRNECKARSQSNPGVFMVHKNGEGQMLAQHKANKGGNKKTTLASF